MAGRRASWSNSKSDSLVSVQWRLMMAGDANEPPDASVARAERPRSPLPLVVAALGGLAVGAALAASLAFALGERAAGSPSPARTGQPTLTVAASASANPSDTAPDRGREDEAQTLSEIEKRPDRERTAAETLALASAQAKRKREQIEELGRKMKLVPKLGYQKETVDEVKKLARDREVGNEALRTLSELPGEVGPDLLHAIWTSTPRKTDSTELAEQLLYAKDMRPKASKALGVALDLRREEDCEKVKALLQTAIEHGDRRSVSPILRLNSKRGCGPKKLDDCWPCLRKTELVKEALKEASRRPPP
jgi:hypothetical protein